MYTTKLVGGQKYRVEFKRFPNVDMKSIKFNNGQKVIVSMINVPNAKNYGMFITMDRHITEGKVLENHGVAAHLTEHMMYENFLFDGERHNLQSLSSKIDKSIKVNGYTSNNEIGVYATLDNSLFTMQVAREHGYTDRQLSNIGLTESKFHKNLTTMIDAVMAITFTSIPTEETLNKQKEIVISECRAQLEHKPLSYAIYGLATDNVMAGSLDGIEEIDLYYMDNYMKALRGRVKYITLIGDFDATADIFDSKYNDNIFERLLPYTYMNDEIVAFTEKMIGAEGHICNNYKNLPNFSSYNFTDFEDQGYVLVMDIPVAKDKIEYQRWFDLLLYLIAGVEAPINAKFREEARLIYGASWSKVNTSNGMVLGITLPCSADVKLLKKHDNMVKKFIKDFTVDRELLQRTIAMRIQDVLNDSMNPAIESFMLDGENSPYRTHTETLQEIWGKSNMIKRQPKKITKSNLEKLALFIEEMVHNVKIIKVTNKKK